MKWKWATRAYEYMLKTANKAVWLEGVISQVTKFVKCLVVCKKKANFAIKIP